MAASFLRNKIDTALYTQAVGRRGRFVSCDVADDFAAGRKPPHFHAVPSVYYLKVQKIYSRTTCSLGSDVKLLMLSS